MDRAPGPSLLDPAAPAGGGSGGRRPDETSPAPLLLLAAGMWLGLALPEVLPAGLAGFLDARPPLPALAAAAAALTVFFAVFFAAPRDRRLAGRLTGLLLFAAFAAGWANRPPPGPPSVVTAARALGEDRLLRPVLLRGRLTAEPEEARAATVLRLEARELEASRRAYAVSGPVRVTVGGERRGRLAALARGSEVEVWSRVSAARGPSNPGAAPFSGPAGLFGNTKSALLVTELRPAPAFWRVVRRARSGIRARLLESGLSRSAAGVAAALLIGDRSLAPAGVERAFRDAGTLHVMAVSGLHVGLLSALLYGVLVLCGVRRRTALTVLLAVLPLYAALAGARPSVLRAALMAGSIIVGFRRGLSGGAPNGLGFAALVLLAAAPGNALEVGFQLSFGVTLAILAALRPRDPAAVPWDRPRWRSRLFAPVAVTLAAQVAGFPIIARAFGRVVFGGLLVAVPAVLLAGPLLGFGFGWLLLGGLPLLGPALLEGLRLSAEWLVGLSRWGADLPFGAFPVARPSWWWFALWIAASLPAIGLRGRRRALPGLALFALALYTLPLGGGGEGSLRLTALDVGAGDALVVELPEGGAVLVDAGTAFADYSAGERVVTPFLVHRGHRRLRAAVPTHLDLDHIGGFSAVFRDFPVDEYWEGPATAGDDRPAARLLRLDRRREGIPVRRVRAGDRIPLGGAVFTVLLAGDAAEWASAAEAPPSPNERSLVLSLDYAGRRTLLTGDAGFPAERLLLARDPDALAASVLKVGHHGSRFSTSAAFLEAVRPRVALISAREDRRRRLPFPEVIERLAAFGARVYRTDHHGAVTAVISKDGALTVRPFRDRPPAAGRR